MLKKLRAALEKCIEFLIKKTSKIDEKSSPKVRKTLLARKIDKKSLPGTPFGATDRFLVDFGDPQGTQKSSQRGAHHWTWTVLAATLGASAHLSQFWLHFLSILAPFWVTLAPIWSHFGSFFVFVFWGGVCFLGCWFVGLLCFWVLGFLSCWVALFLGCWVVGWFGCLLVVGLLGYWVVGLLGWWVVGLLGCWVGGMVDC